jgi:hypothetical protein
MKSFKNADEVNKVFYENMKNSHYAFCYRGWGNFSLRLYETLAAGRIPVIIKSNENLPFPDKIDWNIFPVVNESEQHKVAEIVAAFHAGITEDEFVSLQKKARFIWTEYLTYNNYMGHITKAYITRLYNNDKINSSTEDPSANT